MTWSKDALLVKFSHSKNDLEGNNGCEARKARVQQPSKPVWISNVELALSQSVKPRSNKRNVFIGSLNMANTQRVAIRKPCEGLRLELATLGHEISDFGIHSGRKGATTHCASDTEDGPPLMAVFLRDGWRIAGPKEVYVKFALRGDQAVGRVVPGLHMTQPNAHKWRRISLNRYLIATGIPANVRIFAKIEMLEAGGGEGGNLFEKLREFLRAEDLAAPRATQAGVKELLEDQNKKLE
ncbi:hypothetical protein FVE85_3738 [Porphyridium purpureum]|uniref:Uncharacterized protein n=1 Tax=Porphyridium purpureum TaxID=35688 RepID=A0A5J4YMW3_PORPP|nr:hypothetical protein FVE85_3738 [Porphyridium purpureum]|eukprot:POR7151..scf249_10